MHTSPSPPPRLDRSRSPRQAATILVDAEVLNALQNLPLVLGEWKLALENFGETTRALANANEANHKLTDALMSALKSTTRALEELPKVLVSIKQQANDVQQLSARVEELERLLAAEDIDDDADKDDGDSSDDSKDDKGDGGSKDDGDSKQGDSSTDDDADNDDTGNGDPKDDGDSKQGDSQAVERSTLADSLLKGRYPDEYSRRLGRDPDAVPLPTLRRPCSTSGCGRPRACCDGEEFLWCCRTCNWSCGADHGPDCENKWAMGQQMFAAGGDKGDDKGDDKGGDKGDDKGDDGSGGYGHDEF